MTNPASCPYTMPAGNLFDAQWLDLVMKETCRTDVRGGAIGGDSRVFNW